MRRRKSFNFIDTQEGLALSIDKNYAGGLQQFIRDGQE